VGWSKALNWKNVFKRPGSRASNASADASLKDLYGFQDDDGEAFGTVIKHGVTDTGGQNSHTIIHSLRHAATTTATIHAGICAVSDPNISKNVACRGKIPQPDRVDGALLFA
jgi:hypothetical protein